MPNQTSANSWFTPEQLKGLLDYWQVYEANYEAIQHDAQRWAGDHPILGPLVRNTPKEVSDANSARSHELSRRAIVDGDWATYIADLRTQGAMYAKQGFLFGHWYDLIRWYGRYMVPLLVERFTGSTERLTNAVNGMQELLDRAMGVLGEEYLKTREALIIESEARKSSILEVALDCIVTMDEAGVITEFNPAAERTFGTKRAEAVGKPLADVIIPPRLREAHRKGLARYLATGEQKVLNRRIELSAQRADGTEFPVEVAISRINVSGPAAFTGFIRDLTGRKQAEEALRKSEAHARALEIRAAKAELQESEERFRMLVEAVTDYAIYLLDETGRVVTWNAGAQRIKGYSASEIIGRDFSTFFPPEDIAKGQPQQELEIATKEGRFETEAWRIRKDGTRFFCNIILNALRDADGHLRGFAKITRDLTLSRQAEENERRLFRERVARAAAERAEESAREQAERLRLLAEASRLFVTASVEPEAILQTIARHLAEIIGDNCMVQMLDESSDLRYRAFHDRDPAARALAEELFVGKRVPKNDSSVALARGESVLMPVVASNRRDSEPFEPFTRRFQVHSLVAVPLRNPQGMVGALVLCRHREKRPFSESDLSLVQDLADRAGLALENARLYRELMGAVQVRDDFLAIAGHELKTPLAALLLQLQSLQRAVLKGPPSNLAGRLDKATASGVRLERLIGELLDVSRIAAGRLILEPEPFNLTALVQEVATRFAEGSSPIAVRGEISLPGFWDRLRLDQVVNNLLGNAVKYGLGKSVEVELSVEQGDAVLRVIDHGIGIDEEHQRKIFERFERAVATREYGGFGLGLWIARQIIEASGGEIEVQSKPEQGSTFTVRLPLRSPEASTGLGEARA